VVKKKYIALVHDDAKLKEKMDKYVKRSPCSVGKHILFITGTTTQNF
jgi:methylglyoxal synthase